MQQQQQQQNLAAAHLHYHTDAWQVHSKLCEIVTTTISWHSPNNEGVGQWQNVRLRSGLLWVHPLSACCAVAALCQGVAALAQCHCRKWW